MNFGVTVDEAARALKVLAGAMAEVDRVSPGLARQCELIAAKPWYFPAEFWRGLVFSGKVEAMATKDEGVAK